MKRISLCVVTMMIALSASSTAFAKIAKPVWVAIENAYRPAVWNEGLGTAYVNPDPSKFRNYVVVMQGGIVAERAKRLISWAEYDYRGTTIDMARGTVKTRRGEKYTYLQPGDVMAIAKMSKLGNRVYVSIISPEIYKPINRPSDKKFSRVTATVVFKLPKELASNDDPQEVLRAMGAWLAPFNDLYAALSYARSVGANASQNFPTYNQQLTAKPANPEKKDRLTTSPERPNPYEPPGVPYTKPSY